MHFILPDNLKFVKRFIERTFFGALKLNDSDTQERFLVETVFVDANQYLWCCCADELPVDADKFPVSVKYIDKVKGIYMKVTGIASRIMPQPQPGSAAALDHDIEELTGNNNLTLLRVKMTETVYYKKREDGQINFYALAC
ncbi:hypothetical protein [Paraflavitalea sp. CAU 1676]|uniref:hypothetical protein n=1 Tax=Paraflavitalea sp. CAU 1676 TaxID=3032598 RepID=UPI0023DA9DE2|nr:hypothetical protein [Paraflavitalea sp. CAU 1676]MDF2191677.1 hypothetical protein [Paraflavitalea sp. CAU 1676]